MTEDSSESGMSGHDAPMLDITRGSATEEELAALIAVISEAYSSEAADAVAEEPVVSAWTRTQRPMRRPLRRDIAWGRFSG